MHYFRSRCFWKFAAIRRIGGRIDVNREKGFSGPKNRLYRNRGDAGLEF